MENTISFLCLVFLCIFCVHIGRSQGGNAIAISPFTNIGGNAVKSFSGGNFLALPAAAAATYLLVMTDADYHVHDYFARNIASYDKYTSAALWGGYIAPLAVGGGMYVWGRATDDRRTYAAGCCALQAAGVAMLAGTVLKAVTGRPGPDPSVYPDMREASHIFRFGFLRGGLHYGWPSGHLATNSAWIVSLMTFYNKSVTVQVGGVALIAYLFLGVTAHEGATMHWLSDVIAGTIIGYTIGSTVGRHFRDCYEGGAETADRTDPHFTPVLHREYSGIRVTIPF